MKAKKFLTTAGVALMALGIASSASAFQVRGGARTSVGGGNWQAAHEANVETRQSNRTERESNRQETYRQVSSNRADVVNNYNNNHGCCDHGGWYDDHPIATAAAVTTAAVATAAVVGSIVRSLPPSCSAVNINGAVYQQCGSAWYEPQYSGTTVQYVVVNPPR
ncbi:hypothetical protein [Caballeronia sp. J97]|uniref:hypothetical protein n=1 Tax=Caballeronia sp. J97 TaxID=2805429 RepID=UPI002AB1A5C5|nr:hypothetical protein [Caballeronia sp. J97]